MAEVQEDENLNLSQMTVEAWVRLAGVLDVSGHAILDKNLPPESNPTPSDSNYLLFLEGSMDYLGNPSQHQHSVGWSVGNGTTSARVYSQKTSADLLGEWHHIAGTYDGETLRLYIDGELENEIQAGLQPIHNNGLLTLGWSPVGYLMSWYGRLDEVRIWNVSRAQSEIQQTMNVRMRGVEPGLIAYWNFDEGSGQAAHDLAGNDNDAQLGSTSEPDDQDPDWSGMAAPCDQPLEIVSSNPLPDGKQGSGYSYAFQADGGYWSYTWELISGSLPGGLSLSGEGNLTGTPNEYGDYTFAVRVTDEGSPQDTDEGSFNLHISPPDLVITTASLPDGDEDSAYESILEAQGGVPPYEWSLSSGTLPGGLSLNGGTATISGTPTNAAIGTWLFTVRVEDSQSPAAADERLLSITIRAASPVSITTSSPLPRGKVGIPYSVTLAADGGKLPYGWEVSAGTLPGGFSFSSTGVLSGTPEEYGEFVFSIRVSDSQEPAETASRQYLLSVDPADLSIETASLPSGTEGVALSRTLEASGGVPPYAWEVSTGALPAGLTLGQGTGVISGTPTNAAIGTWQFTVRVSDSQSPSETEERALSMTIFAANPLSIASTSPLPEGKQGQSYSYSFSASGGKLPYAWEVASGAAPPGLSLSGDGTLAGSPTAYGDFSFVVRATDSQQSPENASKEVSVHISPADLRITTSWIPSAIEGVSYSHAMAASGGIPPFSWSIIYGALPEGITLSDSGTLSGTPSNSAIGSWSFTVAVSDSQTPAATDEHGFSISVSPARPLSIVTSGQLPDGKVGNAYQVSLGADGGKRPYQWGIESGSLPNGLVLSPAGAISGTPTAYGNATFIVKVTDSQQDPETSTSSFTVYIAPADLEITTSSLSTGVEGIAYHQTLLAEGGAPAFTWTVTSGTLPDGIALNPGTGVLSGTPTNTAIGRWTFTVSVSDSQLPPAQDSREFSLSISPSSGLRIVTETSLPNGKVAEPYDLTFAAAGGKTPYAWILSWGVLPDGLNLSSNGLLSGAPEVHGDFVFMLEVSDSQDPEERASQQFNLHVAPADLQLITSSLPDGVEGSPYAQQLLVSGGVVPYRWEIVSGLLPDGLSLDPDQGILSGTPSNAAIGTWSFSVRVRDSQIPAATSQRLLSITIEPSAALAILSESPLPDGKVGEAYSLLLAASGGKLPYSWSVESGSLPSGLGLSSEGELSGIPAQYGDYSFTVGVRDGQEPARTATDLFALHISPADLNITTVSLPGGIEGTFYSEELTAAGGVSPYTWEIVSGSLPEGIVLGPGTGRISGIAVNSSIGTSSFVVGVTDNQGSPAHDEIALQLEIEPAESLSVTTGSPLPDGKAGEAYHESLAGSGGKRPYTWALASGVLPTGITLAEDGTLSGAPTEEGEFSFTVRASDSQAVPEEATKDLLLRVDPARLEIIATSLPEGVEGTAYEQIVETVGGVLPRTWSVVDGSLPDGLTLSPMEGILSGTPTNSAIGTSSFTLHVIDSRSPAEEDQAAFSIVIVPAEELAITSTGPLPAAEVAEAYEYWFEASGGKRPYSWTAVSGTLPAGLSLSGNGTLEGTPTEYGDFTVEVEVRDSRETPDSDGAAFSLHVAPEDLAVTTSSLPDGKENSVYSYVLRTKGGMGPLAWSVSGGSLPEGMQLEPSTGLLRGTPTNAAIGKSTFTVRVSDSQWPSDTDEQPLEINILPAADLTIVSTSPLPDGMVGDGFGYTFMATGGKRGYAWSVASGSLPAGLTLTSPGVLNGTPEQHGDYAFVLRVTDSQTVQDSDERQFALHIAPREIELEITPAELTFSARKGGDDPAAQNFTIRVRGSETITWEVQEDCPWLQIDPVSDTNDGEEDVVAVSVSKAGLNIGTYEAEVNVVPLEIPEKHRIVRVSLYVNPIRVPEDYPSIQEGIDAAESSDTVLVASGVYDERIVMPAGVRVVGAGPEETAIDARKEGTVVSMMGDGSLLEGFTVRNGVADNHGNGSPAGGGIYCGAASMRISKCRIIGNSADQGWGGGVYVKSGGSVLIVNSEIAGNSAESGGGVFAHEDSQVRIETSILRQNTAQWFGGGVCGIDLCKVTVTGSEFSRNAAGYSGGAVAGKERCRLTIISCTMGDNAADEAGGVFSESSSWVSLVNCVLWNSPTDLVLLGNYSVGFCDIGDGSFAGQNHNFSLEPSFVDAARGDYHLLPNSPCLDVGDNTVDDLPKTDIDGEPRTMLGYAKMATDLGADELDPETVFAVVRSPVAVGEDGLVTIDYSLWNARANISSVSVEYSADRGESWYKAARALGSESVEGLPTGANGKPHFFIWDSVVDVGGKRIDAAHVRVKPVAAKSHTPTVTETFSLYNAAVDSDNDRLPDNWEQQIVMFDPFDSITGVFDVHAEDDFDGDGHTNRNEYLSGTLPTDPTSALDLIVSLEANGTVRLLCPSVSGRTYAIHFCEGLGAGWNSLGLPQEGNGGLLEYSDTIGDLTRMRFYRISVY